MAGRWVLSHFHRFILQQRILSVVGCVRKHSNDLFSLRSNLASKFKCSKNLHRCANGEGTSELIIILSSSFNFKGNCPGKCTPTLPQTSLLSSRGLSTVQCSRHPTVWSYKRQSGFQSAQYSSRPNENRRKGLMIATYVSGAIGIVLLTAVGFRFYGRFRKRARGIEELDVPHYPRRSRVLNRYRAYNLPSGLIDTVVNDVPWFEVRPDDVWVVSYPKAGTTWLQEIVYLISTDLDFENAKARKLDQRFPYLEFPIPGLQEISKLDSPRFIKSHLPFSLLPKELEEKKPKVIYIARNPKDTVVSLKAFQDLINLYKFLGTMEDFAQNFLQGLSIYGPWTKHVQEGWEQRNKDHVLFVTYEDLHKDFRGTAREIGRFLGKSLSDLQLEELERHCSFSNMQGNDSVNYSWMKGIWKEGHFLRKGEIGDWKRHLSREMSAKFDAMTDSLEPLGLQFVDS